MIDLAGYRIYELINENNCFELYKGCDINDQAPVIIKVLKEETFDSAIVSDFMREYAITRNLDIEGILKPVKADQSEHVFALIFEDIGAVTLREHLKKQPVGIVDFVDIAVGIAEIIEKIHASRVIHRSLNPDNILIKPDTGKIYITDFCNAVQFFNHSNQVAPSALVCPAGSPEYMPPEQTGRVEIFMDRRSDLYSLGVIFYEMLTGTLPFKANNPTEWAYAHLTQKPTPPHQVNDAIPPAISDIITKLLNKNPDERYQSAYGLLCDLRECKSQLVKTGQIRHIDIAKKDKSAQLRLSNAFYGRNEETEMLRAAFSRVCRGAFEIVFVSGEPGIGKTMLVNESLQAVTAGKGYFIAGKVDQLRKNIPYAPYIDAFSNLARQLMTESTKTLTWWKNRILHSIGRNCAVVTEIIPELEWIVGMQQPVEPLPPQEAETRFLNVFKDFIKVFLWKNHPLVLFLDDLQWADRASIKLLEFLMRDTDLSHLLIVGAYRENELGEEHPLLNVIKARSPEDNLVSRLHIQLSPLRMQEAENFVTDSLGTLLPDIDSLTRCLYRKSAGNPFSLKQILQIIHDEGLLYYDSRHERWHWDLESIQAFRQNEDIMDLILSKIQRLPGETRELVKLASCCGNRFDLNSLAAFCGKSVEETARTLIPAVHEGLIIAAETEETASAPGQQVHNKQSQNDLLYEFLHDKVQQAAYSLVTEEEKKQNHVMIGSYLLNNMNMRGSNFEENILAMMDHFNRGLELIQDSGKRLTLARFNLLAGRKARASGAYASALEYFRCARELIQDNAWESDYRLSFELYLEYAQALYLCEDEESAEKLFDFILEKSRSDIDRADVYGLKMTLYAGVGKFAEATYTGLRALQDLGMKIPLRPAALHYAKELVLYKWFMRNRTVEDLYLLPEMKEIKQKKISELLARLCYVSMAVFPDLYSFIILKTGNYVLRSGNSEVAPVGYLGYGITSGIVFGDYRTGDRFAQLCVRLAEKYDLSSYKCIIYFVVGALIHHWTNHAALALDYLRKASAAGNESGNLVIAGYADCVLTENLYITGTRLEHVEEFIREKNELLKKIKHFFLLVSITIYDKVVSAMTGRRSGSLADGAAELDRDEILNLVKEDNSSLATYYWAKMHLRYMAGDYRSALELAQKIRPLLGSIIGFLVYSEFFFYESLVITAVFPELPAREKKYYRRILRNNIRRLEKWAASCKDNFEHKYLLVCAQAASLLNETEKAMLLYEKAISSARTYGYIQNEALACELAGKFYLGRGMEKVAKTYLEDACNAYGKWGAANKVNDLKNRYSDVLGEFAPENTAIQTGKAISSMLNYSAPSAGTAITEFDSYLVKKAVESITNETDINALLEGFLDIIVKSMGADSGCLIFEKDGELFIEALKTSDDTRSKAKTVPLSEYNEVSMSVVNYVARTSDTVAINLGEDFGIFSNDPYISESNPKSIACVPLLLQGIPSGVIYLENNFLPGVFTSQRLEALKLLATQIAFARKLQSYISEVPAGTRHSEHNLIEPLTEREIEVIRLIAQGLSNMEISQNLYMSVNTVKTHVRNIYGKLNVNRRVQAVQKAKELNLI